MSKVVINPGVRVAVLAAPGHGETTLVRALAQRCRRRYPALAAPWDPAAPGYATPRRRYAHAPARDLLGAGPVDVGLLAVAADVGATRAAELQVRLAHWLGVPHVLPFVTRPDRVGGDRDVLHLVEYEVRRLLHENGYPGDDLPVFVGDARDADGAALDGLLDALDAWVLPPAPPPPEAGPLWMAVASVGTPNAEPVFADSYGPQWVLKGRVEGGRVRAGDCVVAHWGDRAPVSARVRRVDGGRRKSAPAGTEAELLVRGEGQLALGPWRYVVVRAGESPPRRSFEAFAVLPATGLVLSEDRQPEVTLSLDFGFARRVAWLRVVEGVQRGGYDPLRVAVHLQAPLPLRPGLPFKAGPITWAEGHQPVFPGHGLVTRLAD